MREHVLERLGNVSEVKSNGAMRMFGRIKRTVLALLMVQERPGQRIQSFFDPEAECLPIQLQVKLNRRSGLELVRISYIDRVHCPSLASYNIPRSISCQQQQKGRPHTKKGEKKKSTPQIALPL
jgi:hypothetical protein